jgi:hypothetical protein
MPFFCFFYYSLYNWPTRRFSCMVYL